MRDICNKPVGTALNNMLHLSKVKHGRVLREERTQTQIILFTAPWALLMRDTLRSDMLHVHGEVVGWGGSTIWRPPTAKG